MKKEIWTAPQVGFKQGSVTILLLAHLTKEMLSTSPYGMHIKACVAKTKAVMT